MFRTLLGKLLWLGRATSAVVGLAVALALVVGVSSAALAGNLDPLKIGSLKNVATKTTQLVGKVATGSALVVKNPSGGSALGLQVNAGQAPLKVNAGAGKATNLDADKLDGLSSNELVRLGLGFREDAIPVVTFTDRATVTVNAPAKGFVLVNGAVSADTAGTSCNPCYTFARARHDNSGQEPAGQLSSLGNGTSSNHRDTLPISWVFPVEAGTNTFTLRTGTFPDSAPVNFFNPTLTALYVPFGTSGTSALMADSEAVSSTQEERGQRSDGVIVK